LFNGSEEGVGVEMDDGTQGEIRFFDSTQRTQRATEKRRGNKGMKSR
jgi:hypothetical protein